MRTLIFSPTIFLSGCAGGMQNTYNLPYSDSNYLDSFQAERKEVTINSIDELNKAFKDGNLRVSYRIVVPSVLEENSNKLAPFNIR